MTLPMLIALGAALSYGTGVFVLRVRGRRWSAWRTFGFIAGCLLLAVAFAPHFASWAAWSMRGHMLQHILVGMLAPLGLMLAAPLTLTYRVLPAAAARRLVAFLKSPPMHALGHPASALILNVGGMYALYLTPLHAAATANAMLRAAVNAHFLLAGCLFVWAIAGPDPAPRRPGFAPRLLVLFLATAAHGYLAKFMYAHGYPLDPLCGADERLAAAKLMFYGGDFAELLLAIALFSQRSTMRGRCPQAPSNTRGNRWRVRTTFSVGTR